MSRRAPVHPNDADDRAPDVLELVPLHCDPTLDRYDVLHLVRGDTQVAVVAIDARGRTQ